MITKTENNMRKTFSIEKINKLITVVTCSVLDSISFHFDGIV